MEKQLFDWEEMECVDTMVAQYTDVTLKQDIGNYKAGQQFKFASLDFEIGKLEVYNGTDPDPIATFDLELKVTNAKA
jgi:hypothetical protein